MNQLFEQRTAEYKAYIESYLADWYSRYQSEPQSVLYDAVRYSLLAGGKRLRPVFAFEFCRMCGADWKNAAPFAAAIEMIHTYSPIHDDLPSMDNDDFRRGRPTNHKVYGEAMAILAGDSLLTDAFAVAAQAGSVEGIKTIADCAGFNGMVGGQVLDIMSEQRTLTEDEVLAIQSRKTGALIVAACACGVIAGGGSKEQVDEAVRFASMLGLAFQIRDDMLDVIGTQEQMGKGVGTDGTKNTFVRLHGLETCEKLVHHYTSMAIESLNVFQDSEYMQSLALALTDRNN
jgi:geranylgeranyl diphosphate synthase type II